MTISPIALLTFALAGSAPAFAGATPPSAPAATTKDPFRGTKCSQVRPEMPASIQKDPAFVRATVVARIDMLPPGTPGPVSIVSSSGHPELDAAVIAAFRDFSCRFEQPLNQPIQLRQSFLFSNESPRPAEPRVDASRCAVLYDRRMAVEQSSQPIRVIEVPAGQFLCWRWKDFAMVSTRSDEGLAILEQDGSGDPVIAAFPGPDNGSNASPAREKVSFHLDEKGVPKLTVWMSTTTPDSGTFSYSAGERDRSVRNLLERWVALEGWRLGWRMPSEGPILDKDRFNAIAELGSAMWLEAAVDGVNQAIAQTGNVGGLNTPMQVCRQGRRVFIQPASVEGCAKRP